MAAAVAERVRSFAPGNSDKLSALRTLVDGLAERERFLAESTTLLKSRLDTYRQADVALDAALRGDKIDNVKAALDSLERAPNCTAAVERALAFCNHSRAMRLPRDGFFRDHPEAREALATVCSLRLDEARKSLMKATEEEQRRLNSLGDDFDARSSPVVKRVAAKVQRLEGMLRRVESEQELSDFFANFAQELLL
jgi:hypothetical protein